MRALFVTCHLHGQGATTCVDRVKNSSRIFLVHYFVSCSAAQKCIVKEDTIKSLNIEAGLCNTANEQSTADVTIHAVNDPNTQVVEKTECNFQCQEGYFDEEKGDKKIPFKCVPNPDRTQPLGTKTVPTPCSGACVICVLTFSIALHLDPVGASVFFLFLSSIIPHLFTLFVCL